jgi:hypothetical protein
MKSSKTILSILLAAAATMGTASAWAHAVLQSAAPAKDAEVAAPKEVVLHFNEKLEAAFSSIKVVDSQGKAVSTDNAVVDEADPAAIKVAVPTLATGKYTVQFVAVGHDGHRRNGQYSFTVK